MTKILDKIESRMGLKSVFDSIRLYYVLLNNEWVSLMSDDRSNDEHKQIEQCVF